MDHTALTNLKEKLHTTISEEQASLYPTLSIEGKLFDNRYYIEQIKHDKNHIESFGIDVTTLTQQLRDACLALESAELLFKANSSKREGAEKVWQEKKESIEKLLAEAHARLNYLAQTDEKEEIGEELQRIQSGTGYKDAIMDLGATSLLVQKYANELATLNYGSEKIEELKESFKLLSKVYPQVTAERSQKSEDILLRNRAFWYLDSLEQHLKRAILPMVFWDNTEKRKAYASPTLKEINRRYRNYKSTIDMAE